MENNKLKVKDLGVNIGIFFSIVYGHRNGSDASCGNHTCSLVARFAGIAGLFGGAFLLLCWQKCLKWDLLLLAIISGILFFATGECTWVIIVTFAVAGILGEIARKIFGYKSFKKALH